jgi:hypothetical protein
MSKQLPADLADALYALVLIFREEPIPDRTDRKPLVRREHLVEKFASYDITRLRAEKLIDHLVHTGVFEAHDPVMREGESFEAELRTVVGLDGTDLGTDITPIRRLVINRAAWDEIAGQGEGERKGENADRWKALRDFAGCELKGQERAVIEALCDADGQLKTADLGVKGGVNWSDAKKQFKDAQRRLNPKLKALGWRLIRNNNAAVLTALKKRSEAPGSRLS